MFWYLITAVCLAGQPCTVEPSQPFLDPSGKDCLVEAARFRQALPAPQPGQLILHDCVRGYEVPMTEPRPTRKLRT
jgi:hypothetical protein